MEERIEIYRRKQEWLQRDDDDDDKFLEKIDIERRKRTQFNILDLTTKPNDSIKVKRFSFIFLFYWSIFIEIWVSCSSCRRSFCFLQFDTFDKYRRKQKEKQFWNWLLMDQRTEKFWSWLVGTKSRPNSFFCIDEILNRELKSDKWFRVDFTLNANGMANDKSFNATFSHNFHYQFPISIKELRYCSLLDSENNMLVNQKFALGIFMATKRRIL